MSAYLIAGGRVVDPAAGRDEVIDVLVEGAVVADVGARLSADVETLDARGCIVAPGFVDLHTHIREPGREDEETIVSASRAAAAGGYTAVCAMPNTDPVADSAAIVEKVWALGREAGLVDVVPAGSLSKGRRGQAMADIGEMARSPARVRVFTDDGDGVQDSLFARRVMEYLVSFDAVYAEHCEDAALAAGGQMHEGERSMRLGLRGIPAEAEELMAARDIALAKMTGCRLHLLHVSTAGTVELVRQAKRDGVRITAEATPHHIALTDEAVESYDPNAKVNPPLRTEDDRRALVAGLADGTIDVFATDHAPHALEEKDAEFEFAPPGMVGLETALAVAVTELVRPGRVDWTRLVDAMSTAPARILGLDAHGGPMSPGRPAHLVVFDPEREWTVDPDRFMSRSKNTPFAGKALRGAVRHTLFGGRPTVVDGRLLHEELV